MSATFSATDRRCMDRALALARRGLGYTSPNPCVGAVLWRGGRVIGEGFHARAGKPHAEVEAVRDARRKGHRVEGATLYVTLEPCSTVGRTPACTDLILGEKLARVVVAASDPNPRHAGAAYPILRKAGIAVSHGLRAAESAALNRAFNHWIVTGRPWVTAKIALSLDGRIAARPGDDRWLTGPAALRLAHELRRESDAILVGGATARADDPRLTIRLPGRRRARAKLQPWRLVWSRSRDFPRDLHLFSDAHRDRTLIVQGSLARLAAQLGRKEVTHLLIEGGGQVLGAAFAAGIVDEVAFFIAPILLGAGPRAVAGEGMRVALEDPIYSRVGADLFCRARVKR